MSGNQALDANNAITPKATIGITPHGSDFYFTMCAIFGLATIVAWLLSLPKPATHRLFHYLLAGARFVACIIYFAMGSNLGQTPVPTEFRETGTREVFYARYINWFIVTPLLLASLLLTARVPVALLVGTIVATWVAIVCGLVGAMVPTTYKWGFGAFGISALLFTFWQILWDGRRSAGELGSSVRMAYLVAGSLLVFVWMMYPIAWGLCEGGNILHPDSEAVFYGVLDLFSLVVFPAVLLRCQKTLTPALLGFETRAAKPLSNGAQVVTENLQYGNRLSSGGYQPGAGSGNPI